MTNKIPASWSEASSDMMENHILAEVLDANTGFSAIDVSGTDNSTGNEYSGSYLFSIGNDGIFRMSAWANGTKNGWLSADLSKDTNIANQLSGAKATKPGAFSVFRDASANTVTILLVMNVTPQDSSENHDLLFCLKDMPELPGSDWQTDESKRSWQLAAFNSTAVAGLTADKIIIESLHTLSSAGQTNAYATVKSAANDATSVVHPFQVSLSSDIKWKKINLGLDIEALNDVQLAYPKDDDNQAGVYTWWTQTDHVNQTEGLRYARFSSGSAYVNELDLDAKGIQAIRALNIPGDDYDYDTTELYAIVGDSLYVYSAQSATNDFTKPVNLLTNPALFNQVKAFHLVPVDGILYMWLHSAAGDKQPITMLKILHDDRLNAKDWDQANKQKLTYLADCDKVAPAVADSAGTVRLFALAKGDEFLTKEKAVAPAHTPLAHFFLNKQTNHWETERMPAPATLDYIRIKSYTNKAQLYDANGIPLNGVAVTVTADNYCTVHMNDAGYRLTPNNSVTVMTDDSGFIEIIHEVSSIPGTNFTLTCGDVSTKIQYDPSVRKTINNTTSTTALNNAKCKQPAGKSTSLVKDQSKTDKLATNMQNAVAATNKVKSVRDMPRAAAPNANITIGDVVHSVMYGGHDPDKLSVSIEQVKQTDTHLVSEDFGGVLEDLFKLVVDFGEGLIEIVIATVEDGLHAIVAIFKAIGAVFEDLFKFLAFIFQFEDFKACKEELEAAINAFGAGINKDINALTKRVDGWISTLTGAKPGNSAFSTLSKGPASEYNQQSSKCSTSAGGTNMKSSSKLGWAHTKFKNGLSSSTAPQSLSLAATAGTEGAAIETFVQSIVAQLQDTGTTLENQIKTDIDNLTSADNSPGHLTFGPFMEKVLEDVWDDLLKLTGDFINDGTTMMESSGAITDYIDAPLEIPIISALINDMMKLLGDDSKVTYLDLLLWGVAIVTTIGYKLVNGDDDDYQDKMQKLNLSSLFSYTAGVIATGNSAQSDLLASDLILDDEDAQALLRAIKGGFALLGLVPFTIRNFMDATPGKNDPSAVNILMFASLSLAAPGSILTVLTTSRFSNGTPDETIEQIEHFEAATRLAFWFAAGAMIKFPSFNKALGETVHTAHTMAELLFAVVKIANAVEKCPPFPAAVTIGLNSGVLFTEYPNAILSKSDGAAGLIFFAVRLICKTVSAILMMGPPQND